MVPQAGYGPVLPSSALFAKQFEGCQDFRTR